MAKVKVFSTTTCPYCKMLKSYLRQKNVVFEEVVLDQQPEQAQTVVDTCGSMGVPCTHIVKDDGTEAKVLGFDKQKINEALGLN